MAAVGEPDKVIEIQPVESPVPPKEKPAPEPQEEPIEVEA